MGRNRLEEPERVRGEHTERIRGKERQKVVQKEARARACVCEFKKGERKAVKRELEMPTDNEENASFFLRKTATV